MYPSEASGTWTLFYEAKAVYVEIITTPKCIVLQF